MTSDKDLRKSLIHEISLCDNRLAHIFKSLRERGWYFQIKVLLKSFVSSDIMIEVVVTSPLLLTALMLMLMNLMLNVKLLPTATPFTWAECCLRKSILRKERKFWKKRFVLEENLSSKGDVVKPWVAPAVDVADFLLLDLPLRKSLRRNPLSRRSLETQSWDFASFRSSLIDSPVSELSHSLAHLWSQVWCQSPGR